MIAWSRRLDAAMQQVAARAMGRFPRPPLLEPLGEVRARLAEQLFAERQPEVAAAQQLYARDREAGREAIGRLAEELVGALRARVPAATPLWSRRGLGARLDALLPTDEMEHIDDPAFPESRRTAAMAALDRLNRGFGSYVRFFDQLLPLLDGARHAAAVGRRLTVLDIASGHAGFALALAELSAARGLRLRIIASDLRSEYLDAGRAVAAARRLDVEFRVADALHLERSFAPGEVDVITCTQTLHHFGPAMTAGLIAEALRAAPHGLLFIDATRALSSLLGLGAVSFLAARDKAFFHDATVTIRKCFVPEELALVARCAPGGEALTTTFFPPGFIRLCTRTSP